MQAITGGLNLIAVVLIFSILVIGHEYGHFLVAKACGMRVDEFGIGFGKRLFSWKRGETLYTINLVPIGGYNKIYGMDVEEPKEREKREAESVSPSAGKGKEKKMPTPPDYSIAPPDDPRAFVNRPLHQRFLVVLAGSVANVVMAVLVVFLMGITMGFPAAEIGGVIPGGPGDGAGLMRGDIITRLNGVRLASTNDLRSAIWFSNGQPLRVAGIRGNDQFSATVIPQQIRWVDSHSCRVGFVYWNDGTVIHVRSGSPAERAGIERGDIILRVDGIRFPSHRLDLEGGSGILSLVVFRGQSRMPIDVEYFDNEISRDSYSSYNFFYDDELVVTDVIAGGVADEAGLRPGDVIVGGGIEMWTDTGAMASTQSPRRMTLDYNRGDRTYRIRLEPDPAFSRIHVLMDDASLPVLVGLPYNHRLTQAGLESGDEIVSVEGIPTPNGITAFLEFERHLGDSITVVALSGGVEKAAVVPVPSETDQEGLREFFRGLRFRTRYFAANPLSSVAAAANKSWEVTRFIFIVLGMLLTGEASISDLSGPVGIASITYQAATNGLVEMVNIMVLLSINLAIFNLLPWPALDGGRILFMFFEVIFRRPVVTVRVENLIHIAGFLLLIILALFITYHDIAKLILSN